MAPSHGGLDPNPSSGQESLLGEPCSLQVGVGFSKVLPIGVATCQFKVDPPATDAHPGGDLEQLQAYLPQTGPSPLGAFEYLGLQPGEYQVGKARIP